MSVVQAAPSNAPGAFPTPFRGGVVTVTNIGDMTFMLFREYAPHTVDVIQGLTESGLYTSNTIFHRVVPGFVIQGGDPSTNGTGGPVFRYDDEFNPQAIFSGNGQLALANSGKDTDGSQFFVTSGPQRFLDFGYTLFGQLVRGFNVLTNIINTPTDANSRPLADVIITKASLVPDTSDTVLTLISTNITGVVGTISVIADDGAGGRATNYFHRHHRDRCDCRIGVPISQHGHQPGRAGEQAADKYCGRLRVIPGRIEYWSVILWRCEFLRQRNKLVRKHRVQRQLQWVVVPNSQLRRPGEFYFLCQFTIPLLPRYDQQLYTFTFGDTPISAQSTNFTALALIPFTNQLLATFTNGVPNSPTNNFTAFINWGDNSTNSGVIAMGPNGRKEVLGSHTYTNAGDYPIYLTIQSTIGASATVVSTASVPPSFEFNPAAGGKMSSVWPAWATDYQLQSNTNLSAANWLAVSNFSTLVGYQSVVSNNTNRGQSFLQARRSKRRETYVACPSANTAEIFLKFLQGPGPVTQLVFHLVAQLGKGLLEAHRHKQRVVTETVLPARREDNPAFTNAVEQFRLHLEFIRVTNRRRDFDFFRQHGRQSNDAMKPGRAFFQRNVFEQAQQFGVVVGIGCSFRMSSRSNPARRTAPNARPARHSARPLPGRNHRPEQNSALNVEC